MYVGDAITGIASAIGAVIAAANPITLVVVAIGAVVAALVVFFTKTKLGKKLWGEFTDFLSNAWNKLKELASSAWERNQGRGQLSSPGYRGRLEWRKAMV